MFLLLKCSAFWIQGFNWLHYFCYAYFCGKVKKKLLMYFSVLLLSAHWGLAIILAGWGLWKGKTVKRTKASRIITGEQTEWKMNHLPVQHSNKLEKETGMQYKKVSSTEGERHSDTLEKCKVFNKNFSVAYT